MRIILALMILTLSSCAHETIYHYCTEHADDYGGYENCYQERKVELEENTARRRAAAAALQQMGESISNSTKQNTTCFTTYGGGTAVTNCH